MGRYRPYRNVLFEDRTVGGLLQEFYYVIAEELSILSGLDNPTDDQLRRIADLEDILKPPMGDRISLVGLSGLEVEEVMTTAHKTGDPLVDYWEYRLSKDLPVDLDLKQPPPRDQWDNC